MANTALGTSALGRRKFQTGRSTGFLMVLIGGALWGLSGTSAQQLFQGDGFTPGWLVTMRMGISGILLLLMVGLKSGWKHVFDIWRAPKDRLRLLIFGIVGLAGVQYTYFASIQQGNAATATFLQYLAPAFIIVFLALQLRKSPGRRETTALALALVGTFLLVTNGSFSTIVVPWSCVVWGLLSALALAFYTLYPKKLMDKHGSALTIGWAMFIGSLAMTPFVKPWHMEGQTWSAESAMLVIFVILFGTLIAFYLYLASMKYITPSETSLLANIEPLSAAAAGVLWLHTTLGFTTIIGGLCILAVVGVLTTKRRPA